jgi:hypothetical protein
MQHSGLPHALEELWRNSEGTLEELWRNSGGTLKEL